MKKWRLNTIILLFCLFSYNAHSQINCTVPLAPLLTSVSVQPESGFTEFNWTPTSDTAIAAWVFYTYRDGTGMSFDTLWNPSAENFTYANSSAGHFSVSYVIAAHRKPNCTSPLSNVLSTIFCTSEIDTCQNKIILKWNSYPDYPKKVSEYKIFVSVDGGVLSDLYSAGKTTNSFLISDFTTNANYCFVVKAVLEDGSLSSSNKSCLSTRMQRSPEWINADYATVGTDKKISLSFTIDPLSEITQFSLERKDGQYAGFAEIARLPLVNGTILFTDNEADVRIPYLYRLSAINNCNVPVKISNIASNMVLSIETIGSVLNLSWNSYKEWSGNISSYRIFLNNGDGFTERALLLPTDTVFSLMYPEIMYDVSSDNVCFYVSASETSNSHGITGLSKSSEICIASPEIITVPNVFTPNSGTVNAYFSPVLTFTPGEFHIIISDRYGKILFESRDYLEKWDGKLNGTPQPQGVVLWFLKVTSLSGKSITRSGTLTIINNH